MPPPSPPPNVFRHHRHMQERNAWNLLNLQLLPHFSLNRFAKSAKLAKRDHNGQYRRHKTICILY
jgi:hypothetical protein